MKILVTGFAGFIGNELGIRLAHDGHSVTGLDNINSYYDPRLKLARLERAGIIPPRGCPETLSVPATGAHREAVAIPDIPYGTIIGSTKHPELSFIRLDINSSEAMRMLFEAEKFDVVVNLAAQAGVRYSIENPESYIRSNIDGFANVLECCRHCGVKHLVYASSSSVYGNNVKVPFSESDRIDEPVSLYAATKKSNELMAGVYTRLYGFRATGLRFFTVYGPWGRPDMAPMLFSEAIFSDRPIKVFNHGDMKRDFTYIDDIVEGIARVTEMPAPRETLHNVYNIGCGHPEPLMRFIGELERSLGKVAEKEMLPMQPGDVPSTWADTSRLENDYDYRPQTDMPEGVKRFALWLMSYRKQQHK